MFGNAWPDQTACKSRVRLRLSRWDAGKLGNPAPSVGSIANGDKRIDGGLYLGYGAVAYDKASKGTQLEHAPAIDAGETATLRIGVRARSGDAPDDTADIANALALMSRYGTVGGRSRNAWGSFVLDGDDLSTADTNTILKDWRDALALEWATGIGQDESGPLIWATEAKKDWRKAMQALAQQRSDINRSVQSAAERALLSYPVTKKDLREWGNNARLPNSLRLKIVEERGGLRGLIFHMPCHPPQELWEQHPWHTDTSRLQKLWQEVHHDLDRSNKLERVTA